MKLKYAGLLIMMAGLLVIISCKKQTTIFPDPYAGGKAPLGIVSDPQQIPSPATGGAGTVVTITATGLLPYKDKLSFLFNGSTAIIKTITATGITVEVPKNASSGITAFVVDGQLVFGPLFNVIGKIAVDLTFLNTVGANGFVYKAIPEPLTKNIFLVGGFTNYANQGFISPNNRFVRVLPNGTFDRNFKSGYGANSNVYDLAKVGNYYYLAGDFTGYGQQGGLVGRIAKISTLGTIDTVQVTTYLKQTIFVPSFNGGFTGGTTNIYPVGTNKMIVVGNYNFYISHRYDQPTYKYKDSTITDSVDVRLISRLNDNGSLDTTWRFLPHELGYKNLLGKSLPGPNGPISGSIMDANGKLLIYGRFTTFDGSPANGIVRLNAADGTIDKTFSIGTGSDNGFLENLTYNAALNKYIVTGEFNTFNGKPTKYVVKLNYDGSVDESFATKVFDGGYPTFAQILASGLIVIGGTFRSYDGVIRNGFAVVDPTGALADGYNNIGNLNGQIQNIFETTSEDGQHALLIMGSFNLFDNKVRNNIVRVTIQ